MSWVLTIAGALLFLSGGFVALSPAIESRSLRWKGAAFLLAGALFVYRGLRADVPGTLAWDTLGWSFLLAGQAVEFAGQWKERRAHGLPRARARGVFALVLALLAVALACGFVVETIDASQPGDASTQVRK